MLETRFAVALAVSMLAWPIFTTADELNTSRRVVSNTPERAVSVRSSGQSRAIRLGPIAQHDPKTRPRVVVSDWTQEDAVSAGRMVNHSTDFSRRDADAQATSDSVQQRWINEVEIPTRIRDISGRIQVVEAMLESDRLRLDRLSELNAYAAPATFGFFPSDIWPGVETYNPVTVDGPVRSFSPRSSFSHVLAALENRRELSELELRALHHEREQIAAAFQANTLQATMVVDWEGGALQAKRLAAIDAELRLAEFRSQSFEARLQQIDSLSQLTFSGGVHDLRERVLLEQKKTELRIADLRFSQRLVRDFDTGSSGNPASNARLAVVD